MISAASKRRLWPFVTVGAAAALTLAGCGGEEGRVTLPSTSPDPASTSGGSPTVSASPAAPRDVVIRDYTASYPNVDKALLAPAEQIRSILKEYATGWYLDFQVRLLVDEQAQHLEPWGKPVVHVTKVDLTGKDALVYDCQDASNAGLADARTHQLRPKTRGTAHRNLIAKLILGNDGRWRLSDLKQYRSKCHVS